MVLAPAISWVTAMAFHLASPDEAARRVLAYLARPDFGSQPVADVRD